MKCCEILADETFAILRFRLMRCSGDNYMNAGGRCDVIAKPVALACFAIA